MLRAMAPKRVSGLSMRAYKLASRPPFRMQFHEVIFRSTAQTFLICLIIWNPLRIILVVEYLTRSFVLILL
jgi:hypothetical protein